jgi:VanZ family protein
MTRAHIIIFRLLLIGALAAITFLATTREESLLLKDISDKANHILAFYVLALLVDFSFPKEKLGFAKVSALLTYGLLIEITQSFLPNRTASLLDLVADGVGLAFYKLSLPLLRHVSTLGRRWTRQV